MQHRLAVVLMLCAAQALAGDTYQGYDVKQESFKIAGGEKITLPVTKVGPIPAENEQVKIEIAAFNIAFKNKPQTLEWQFGLLSKTAQKIQKITVEQVCDVDQPRALVAVSEPELKENHWFATSAQEPITEEANPWLHSMFATTFVFKFTVVIEGQPPMVLYQPATFSGSVKTRMVNVAKMMRQNS